MRKPEDTPAMYPQSYVDFLKNEIEYWRKQCYDLQIKLRMANMNNFEMVQEFHDKFEMAKYE